MCFHVRITLTEVHKKLERSILAIGDTVLIEDVNKYTILTNVQRKYTEISYSLDDEPDEKDKDDVKMNGDDLDSGDEDVRIKDSTGLHGVKSDLITTSRLR